MKRDESGVEATEEGNTRKRGWRWSWAVARDVLMIILTILGILVTIWVSQIVPVVKTVRAVLQGVDARVGQVEKRMLQADFKITYPQDGATVDATGIVKGHTPYGDMKHYLVVTPLKVGDDWVEDGPLKVVSGGAFTGRAKFGEAEAGAGEQFAVRLLATQATLTPGPLLEVPKDAVFSESVVVTRKP
jgi:hypothetical protein